MSITLKVHQFKHVPAKCLAFVTDAVNVLMNEVVYDDKPGVKTFVTDALATCAAVAFFGADLGHTTVFTHMASASTAVDDVRKEDVLNQMLELLLKKISYLILNYLFLLLPLRAMESRRRGRVVPGSLRAGCFSAGKI